MREVQTLDDERVGESHTLELLLSLGYAKEKGMILTSVRNLTKVENYGCKGVSWR